MPVVRFATNSYVSRSLPVSAERCINMFTEKEPPDAKAPLPLFGAPGLTTFADAGDGPIRGAWFAQTTLYVASGSQFYKVAPDGTATLLGSGIDGTGTVMMSDNGSQVIVVTGTSGYVYNFNGNITTLTQTANFGDTTVNVSSTAGMSNGDTLEITLDSGAVFTTGAADVNPFALTIQISQGLPSSAGIGNSVNDTTPSFSKISNPAFYPCNTVTYFDSCFVFDRKGTNEFFLSNLNDGLNYNALRVASAEVNPDNVVAVVNNLEQLYIFGQTSTELWYDAGSADFPFQRYDGATIERGLAAAHAFVKQDQAIFFLGDDKIFYRMQGYYPIPVSTPAVDQAIQSYGDISDAFCFTYTLGGHKQVGITFPSANATWIFDLQSGFWHERISWDENNVSLGRWRGNCAVTCYNHILIGDAYNGRVGILDWSVYSEYGNTIMGQACSTPLASDRKRVFMSRFELDVEAGVGLSTGQGSNPQIMLDYSDDGGRTWSKQQLWRSLGVIGAFLTRVRWLRMGNFRQRVLRLTITDPVKRTIIAAHADLSAGM